MSIGYLALRSEHIHAKFTGDIASKGSHKVHARAVSRIGGLCIFLGWSVGLVASAVYGPLSLTATALWVACLLPAFAVGFAEDLTKKVPPVARLVASFVSAGMAYVLLGAALTRTDVYGLDTLLALPILSFMFTLFAIGGVAQAINIIDGLNGFASGVCLVALLALGYVAFQVGDEQLVLLCGLGAGAILGFRIWNYPSGRIFCGDGGAYFLGAYVAVLSVLLVQRHAEVSPWFPLLLLLYPIWETVFSAYRRRVLRGRPASSADKLHMHTLFYKRVKNPLVNGKKVRARRNSDASVTMMRLACVSTVPAVLWWSDTTYLIASAAVYMVFYLAIYRRLVRFGTRAPAGSRKGAGAYVAGRVAALQRAAASRRTVRQIEKGARSIDQDPA